MVEANEPINGLRLRIYDILNVVDEYAKEPFDRASLEELTNQLHIVSQDVDCLIVSAEMSFVSIDMWMRWLKSHKSCNNTAMDLVFYLVTQQDSEANTSVALDARVDSTSMKIIAILKMASLTPSDMSASFGMAFFNVSDSGGLGMLSGV
ncbi:hypothetical protein N0V93_005494 [Gnomoniopsis smithogilvyi]|uniref:Uncharacterized protein n=1 Tax=Gnomoniopsis smithogilvyi TaxID=1191159 RepID=A0A9W8YWR1_9PEZI|nr:hypothetical protein N0V93_005494 [Gnomoniopsis smithogilvyi]